MIYVLSNTQTEDARNVLLHVHLLVTFRVRLVFAHQSCSSHKVALVRARCTKILARSHVIPFRIHAEFLLFDRDMSSIVNQAVPCVIGLVLSLGLVQAIGGVIKVPHLDRCARVRVEHHVVFGLRVRHVEIHSTVVRIDHHIFDTLILVVLEMLIIVDNLHDFPDAIDIRTLFFRQQNLPPGENVRLIRECRKLVLVTHIDSKWVHLVTFSVVVDVHNGDDGAYHAFVVILRRHLPGMHLKLDCGRIHDLAHVADQLCFINENAHRPAR